jgi:hypothetical protein
MAASMTTNNSGFARLFRFRQPKEVDMRSVARLTLVPCLFLSLKLLAQCPNDAQTMSDFRDCCECGFQRLVTFCGGIGGSGCDSFGGPLLPCCDNCFLQSASACGGGRPIRPFTIESPIFTAVARQSSCTIGFQSWVKEKLRQQREVTASLRNEKPPRTER